MTMKTLAAVLAVAVMSASPAAAADSLNDASASAQTAARGSRATASRAAIIAAISRVISVYKGDGEARAYPLRCLGERNYPIFHQQVANLAIVALRLEQGRYPGADGLKAVREELEFPASELRRFGQSQCLSFPSERARATWNGALEELYQPD